MSNAFEFLQAMGTVTEDQQAAVAERGLLEGRWTRDQVTAFFELPDRQPSPKQQPARAPAITRRERLSRRRCSFSRYVRRFSIDVLVHPGLSTGAIATLVYLISRCGRQKRLQTCTSWLAADLGVTPRTIQNHYRLLERAGFLIRSSPDRLGRTTIYLTDLVEVRPLQKDAAESLVDHEVGAKNCSSTNEKDSINRINDRSERTTKCCIAAEANGAQMIRSANKESRDVTSGGLPYPSSKKWYPDNAFVRFPDSGSQRTIDRRDLHPISPTSASSLATITRFKAQQADCSQTARLRVE